MHDADATYPGIDTIVHLGAGTCSELDNWLAANPRRVLLVEANPAMVRRLNAAAQRDQRIQIINQAVAGEAGASTLRVFNMPALSSLREPTGLLELFPGLRTERELDVEVIEPCTFIESLELEPDRKHWLVIDTPGQEADIVNALHVGGQLKHFERIVLRCGVEALYQGSAPAGEILEQLKEAGYDIAQRDDSDPDHPCWSLQRNTLRLENQALRQQIAELEQQTQVLTQSRDEHTKKAEERQQALKALEKDKQGLEKKIAELEAQTQELAQSRDEQRKKSEERQDEIAGLKKSVKDARQKESEYQARIQELEAKEAELKNRQSQLVEEMTRAEGQIDLIKDVIFREPGL